MTSGGEAGKTTLKFTMEKAGPVVIAFHADCAVDGSTTWPDSDIQVDPAGSGGVAPTAPANDANALCNRLRGGAGRQRRRWARWSRASWSCRRGLTR